ncbi:hypothetical protein R1flu_000485 [Riccia fluitans]|uniref:BTB domain-containing protein n=1 Tax=Riccia fluitans TaxID=41844 RepID=A0ABD1Y0K6_9MARC
MRRSLHLYTSINDDDSESDKEASSETRKELRRLASDLRRMLNNPKVTDVIFVCGDGEEVHASRTILAARSRVMEALLYNGMAESSCRTINLPAMTSSTLTQVLTYLYTGRFHARDVPDDTSDDPDDCDMTEWRRLSDGPIPLERKWRQMVDIITAARYFQITRLEKIVSRKLWTRVSERVLLVENMLDSVARCLSILSTLCGEGERNKTQLDAIRLRMVQMLVSHDIGVVTLSYLSKEAFCYYLERTKYLSKTNEWRCSLEDYRRVRQILHWCVSAGDEEFACLPSVESVAGFLENGNELRLFESAKDQSDLDKSRENFLNQAAEKKEVLNALVPWVDFTSLHPEILVSILKPLQIIDAEVFDRISFIQTDRCSQRLRTRGSHNRFYIRDGVSVSEPASEIEFQSGSICTKRSNGVYVAHETFYADSPMHVYGIYKWNLLPSSIPTLSIEEGEDPLASLTGLQFGFLNLYQGENLCFDEAVECLSENLRGWALVILGDLGSARFYSHSRESDHVWTLPKGTRFELNREIEVELNVVQKTCKFSYGQHSVQITFSCPFGGFLYPAVSVPNETVGVTMTLREGFDQYIVLTQEGFKEGFLLADSSPGIFDQDEEESSSSSFSD